MALIEYCKQHLHAISNALPLLNQTAKDLLATGLQTLHNNAHPFVEDPSKLAEYVRRDCPEVVENARTIFEPLTTTNASNQYVRTNQYEDRGSLDTNQQISHRPDRESAAVWGEGEGLL